MAVSFRDAGLMSAGMTLRSGALASFCWKERSDFLLPAQDRTVSALSARTSATHLFEQSLPGAPWQQHQRIGTIAAKK